MEQNKNNTKKIVILITIIAIFISSLIFFAIFNKSEAPDQTNTDNNITTESENREDNIERPSESGESNIPEDYVEYNNEKYNFSLYYPEYFEEFGGIFSFSLDGETLSTLGDRSTAMEGTGAPWDGFDLSVDINNNSYTLIEYIEQLKNSREILSIQELNLGENYEAYELEIGGFTNETIESQGGISTGIYIKSLNRDLIVIISPARDFEELETIYKSVTIY